MGSIWNEKEKVWTRRNTYIKTGHTFLGWSETTNGEVEYEDEEEIENLIASGNKTLYAVWEKNIHKITLISNPNGSIKIDGVEIENGEKEYEYGK